jgi:hypothetical protein
MVSFRRILVAAIATLLVAGACTSINIPSIPPLNLPTIPAINVPGFTIPPINIPGVTIPPLGGGTTGTVPCGLTTAAEVGSILGSQVTDSSDSATNCTFTLPNFTALSVQTSSDTDLTGVQFLMGQSAQQTTIGGFPALSGTVLGQPAVYIQKPSGQVQVLGVLLGGDPATITKLQQIAALVAGRTP